MYEAISAIERTPTSLQRSLASGPCGADAEMRRRPSRPPSPASPASPAGPACLFVSICFICRVYCLCLCINVYKPRKPCMPCETCMPCKTPVSVKKHSSG